MRNRKTKKSSTNSSKCNKKKCNYLLKKKCVKCTHKQSGGTCIWYSVLSADQLKVSSEAQDYWGKPSREIMLQLWEGTMHREQSGSCQCRHTSQMTSHIEEAEQPIRRDVFLGEFPFHQSVLGWRSLYLSLRVTVYTPFWTFKGKRPKSNHNKVSNIGFGNKTHFFLIYFTWTWFVLFKLISINYLSS